MFSQTPRRRGASPLSGTRGFLITRFAGTGLGMTKGLLTEVTQFDNYRTVRTKSNPTVQLQPGQFERIAKALSDPRRFAILEAIGSSCGCPNQSLCQDFSVTKATISHHLKELVQAGLVETEREGQYLSARPRPDVLKAYADELVRRVTGST